ncbi:MAG TPA: TonB-dependent receptor [Acetobacteraceae bacterium]|nr:TonB-dependent receptor [Acetobacteraceae bacterium]
MENIKSRLHRGLLYGAACAALALPSVGWAQAASRAHYHQPSLPMAQALRALAANSNAQVLFSPGDVAGLTAPRLEGDFTVHEAVERLIQGTSLSADTSDGAIIIRGRGTPPAEEVTGTAEQPSAIVVTGSRIRGAPVASQVTTLTREDMRNAGQNNLGDVIRDIPQNAPGGQNPGVVMGSSRVTDTNVNSTSSLNLRGLGPDATLTLINGHRASYDSAIQSVDVSSIPLLAVDRIEVVADGASALYGSDAVGGVANVILRQDYDGLYTSARIGSTTRGGDFEQQYDALTGKRWSGGGFMASAEYGRSSAVTAGDRSFTSAMDPSATLYPRQRYVDLVAAGHQALAPGVRFDVDGGYNERRTLIVVPLTTSGGFQANGTVATPRVRAFSVSPRLTFDLPAGWRAVLSGTYGKDSTRLDTRYFFAGSVLESFPGHYDNSLKVVELSAEGPLFRLPGGDARVVLGGGYRSNHLDLYLATAFGNIVEPNTVFDRSRNAAYGYGEIYLPFVSPALDIGGIHSLSASAAVRYESYLDVDHVATPKLGLIYAPVDGVELKASWGKSFKAPTLYQQFSGTRAVLVDPIFFGASGYPAGSTILLREGSNPDLKPEKATSWTTTLSLHPTFVPGFKLDVSYFHVAYRNRIVQPLVNDDGALSDPIYRSVITTNPSAELQQAAISDAAVGLENFAGVAYNPNAVAVLFDDRFRNAARQKINGVDLSVDYKLDLSAGRSLALTGLATYLDSRQQLSGEQPLTALSGTIFNPPRWRGRFGAIWSSKSLTASTYVNVIGRLTDNRSAPVRAIGGMTTADATIRYHAPDNRGLPGGLDVTFSVTNFTDAKPPHIIVSAPYAPPYDSTNHSALGRAVSLTVGKRW